LHKLYKLKYVPDSRTPWNRMSMCFDTLIDMLQKETDRTRVTLPLKREEKIDTTKKERVPTEMSETFTAKAKEWVERGFPTVGLNPFNMLIEEIKKWYCSTLDGGFGLNRYNLKFRFYSHAHRQKDIEEECEAVRSHGYAEDTPASFIAQRDSMRKNIEYRMMVIRMWVKFYPHKINDHMLRDGWEEDPDKERENKIADIISACGYFPSCAFDLDVYTRCRDSPSLAETLAHNGITLDRVVDEWMLSIPIDRLRISDPNPNTFRFFVEAQKKVKREVGMRLLLLKKYVDNEIGVDMPYDVLQMISDLIIQIG